MKMQSFIGDDTAVTVFYEVTPYQPAVWSGHNACDAQPAEVVINSVVFSELQPLEGCFDIWPHFAEADRDLLYGRVLNELEKKAEGEL